MIEAAPERAELKRELFAALSRVCGPEAVLATNTSSIPVTSLAGAAERPENVVGMHFFNPPPLMKLLEVIRAEQTGERALELARAAGEAMGKRGDPGRRRARLPRQPLRPARSAARALRLLQERVAAHEQIDRICRLGGGFRMGPFELMDLVGIDVGFEVAKSFTELSFGEPRWRPNPIQARMVAAGRLGRKTGRGYYDYPADGPYRPEDPEPPAPGGGDGTLVAILGAGPLADGLRERARAAGYELREGGPAELVVDAGVAARRRAARRRAAASCCAPRPAWPRAASRARSASTLLPPLDASRLVELTRLPSAQAFAAEAAEELLRAGSASQSSGWSDAPGLVLGRIVCQLVNEACFAIGEGVGSPRTWTPA